MDLWEMVNDEYEEPNEEDKDFAKLQKEGRKRDAIALRYIQQGVGKTIFPRIFGVKKDIDAWEILKQEFQRTEKTIALKLQSLWRDFDNLKMEDRESVRDFSTRVAEIVNQIKGCGDAIEEIRIVQKVLRCLPQKFDHAAAAIEESKDLTKMSLYELTGSLLAHEQRIDRSENPTTEQAFQSKKVSDPNFKTQGGPSYNKSSRPNQKKGNWKDKQSQICKKSRRKKCCFDRYKN